MPTVKKYFSGLASLFSQTVNALVLGGHHDMSLSARCFTEHQLLGNYKWGPIHFFIDQLFFWEYSHCEKSFLRDVEYSKEILDYYRIYQENAQS